MSYSTEQRLNYEMLIERHREKFAASLPKYSETAACAQERRQLVLKEYPVYINVQVAREDFPSIGAKIRVGYLKSAQQGAWKQFLQEVRRELQIEFIDSVYTKKDKTPVHRVSSLQDGGSYFVRQRESSAILEVLYTSTPPQQYSWPVTRTINSSKEQLQTRENALPSLHDKVHHLVSKPIVRPQERESMKTILAATDAQAIIEILDQVMTSEDAPPESEKERELRVFEENKRVRALQYLNKDSADTDDPVVKMLMQASRSANRTHDKQVDVVSLHRLALESMQRLVVKHKQESGAHDADVSVDVMVCFVDRVVKAFITETDIVVMGLNLLIELFPLLSRHKRLVLDIILGIMQSYAPLAPPNRPRRPKRLQLPKAEESVQQQVQEALRMVDMMLREEMEARKSHGESVMEERNVTSADSDFSDGTESRRQSTTLKLPVIEVRSSSTTAPASEPAAEVSAAPKRTWKGGATASRRVAKAENQGNLDDDANGGAFALQKLVLTPLPPTDGVKFRGLSDLKKQSNKELGLVKAMSTFYSFLIAHPSNIEMATTCGADEEVAEVALVCQGLPRVLEYVVWIIDKICRNNEDDDDSREFSDDWEELACSGLTRAVHQPYPTGGVSEAKIKGRMSIKDMPSQSHSQAGPWKEALVLAMSLASGHAMVNDKDRITANGWLQKWDDGSRNYRLICAKGLNMTGL